MKKTPNETLAAIQSDLKKRDELKPLFDQFASLQTIADRNGVHLNTVRRVMEGKVSCD